MGPAEYCSRKVAIVENGFPEIGFGEIGFMKFYSGEPSGAEPYSVEGSMAEVALFHTERKTEPITLFQREPKHLAAGEDTFLNHRIGRYRHAEITILELAFRKHRVRQVRSVERAVTKNASLILDPGW